MKTVSSRFATRFVIIALATSTLGSCALFSGKRVASTSNERECLARAMYFESNRSSDDGMLAVGTVVMNRKESGRYPATICGVVGQRVQFAPGVLVRPMTDSGRERAFRIADQVIAGKRYPGMKNVHFFHTAGYTYPYSNMHYVTIAGGNAFYEKRTRTPAGSTQPVVTQLAQADLPIREQARPIVKPPVYVPEAAPMQVAANDAVVEPPVVEPPVRRAPPRKPVAVMAMNEADGAVPEALPPERPRTSVGLVNARGPRATPSDGMSAVPPRKPAFRAAVAEPQPKFSFQQGPSGKPAAPIRAKPETQAAPVSVRVQTIRVQADLPADEAPAPLPRRSGKKAGSTLEPQPLY